jgi:hypothetical protein
MDNSIRCNCGNILKVNTQCPNCREFVIPANQDKQVKIPSRTWYSVKLPGCEWECIELTEEMVFEHISRGAIVFRGKNTMIESMIAKTTVRHVIRRKHAHYFKPVAGFCEVDVYRVLRMFNVTDQAVGHAIKKLLVAGGRGAGKDVTRDVQEAIDTLTRWQELEAEDTTAKQNIAYEDRPL